MLTLKRSGIMTWLYQNSPSYTAVHLTLPISNKQTNKQHFKKQTDLDMTANSSSRLCLPLCKEKKQKSTFLTQLLLGPVRHTLGHQNTKIFNIPKMISSYGCPVYFFFFNNTTNKVKQDWERKKTVETFDKNGPITTSSYLTQGLKRVPPRLVNQSLVRG